MATALFSTDWAEGGFGVEDAIGFTAALRDIGCDYACVSSGALVASQQIKPAPGFQVPFAAAVRKRTGIVTRAVGLITHAKQADQIVSSGQADLIALGRAMLDNPRWGWHAAEVLGEKIVYPPQYERCGLEAWPGAKLVRPRDPTYQSRPRGRTLLQSLGYGDRGQARSHKAPNSNGA